MGIVIRQSVKTTLVTFWGAILGALINYVFALVFSKTELGFYTNFIYAAALLQAFALMGTGYFIVVYSQKYPEEDVRRKVLISMSFCVIVLTACFFTIFYYLLKDEIINIYKVQDRVYVERYFFMIPFLTCCWAIMSFMDCVLISDHKVAISAFIREIILRIINIIFLALYVSDIISFHGFMLSTFVTYSVPTLLLIFIALKRSSYFGFSFKFSLFSRSEYGEFARFMWYHLLVAVTVYLMSYLDSLMLAPLDKDGMQSLAVYRIAIFIISVMVIPYRAIINASYAVLNKAYLDTDKTILPGLFSRSALNIMVVSVGMFIIIAANLDNAVKILPPGYESIKPLVIILMIGRLADMGSGLNSEVISISSYYKFNFRSSIFLVALLYALNRIFIPQYGIYGAAWGATLSLLLFNVLKIVFLWKKMQLQPFNRNTLFVLLAGAFAFIPVYFIPHFINPVIDTIFKSLLLCALYIVFILMFKASPDLKNYLIHIKTNKKLY